MNNLKSILSFYPTKVRKQFNKVVNSFDEINHLFVDIITFGSLVNGEFSYFSDNNKIQLISDFEFAIITKKELGFSDRAVIENIVNEYNEEAFKEHLGHYLSVATNTLDEFEERLIKDQMWCNVLKVTGKPIFNRYDIIIREEKYGKLSVQKEVLYDIFKKFAIYILIGLDFRLISDNSNKRVYWKAIIIKGTLKLLYIYCLALSLSYPVNYKEALKKLKQVDNSLPIKEFRQLIEIKQNNFNDKDECISEKAIVIFMDLNSRFKEMVGRELFKDTSRVLDLLYKIIRLDLESAHFSIKRIRLSKDFLKLKGFHYSFYKDKYDIHV